MSYFWNDFDLKIPPLVTQSVPDGKFAVRIHHGISIYFKDFTDENAEFQQAAALLSRLMARRKNSFRRMIGFRSIRKIVTAVSRLQRLNIVHVLESFHSLLPDAAFVNGNNIEVPMRDNLDYVLGRLIGVNLNFLHIRQCCVNGADYFGKMLSCNYFMDFNALLLAVFAKIRSLSTLLMNRHAKLYNTLIRYRHHFPVNPNITPLVPEGEELPDELEMIIETDDQSDTEASTATTSILAPVNKSAMLVVPKYKHKSDQGTVVERHSKQMKFDINELNTIDDVKNFIVAETKSRKQTPQNCITKHIQSHEWSGALKLFEKKLLTNEHKKALSIFRKFLSTKI